MVFDLVFSCNGNVDVFKKEFNIDRIIIDILSKYEKDYDYILLDCPAGIDNKTLSLSAYCDSRFVIITPDKSSITDAYATIKILNKIYGVRENHLLFNKINSNDQYLRLVKSLLEVTDRFLSIRTNILGKISRWDKKINLFDQNLEKKSIHRINNEFINIIKRMDVKHERGFSPFSPAVESIKV